ncbi:MAG: SHOCT domain-containing protein [Amaricoccus sp.]
MLGSRRGRPSLIGRAAQTAARTAVIAGTATAVSGKVAARQGAPAAPAVPPAAAAPQAPATAPAAMSDDAIARLKQLADLHQAGVLTAEEFAEQKARLLA